MNKVFIITGALGGFFATVLGAFGAHALKSILSAPMLSVYQTGVSYQFYHSLALLLLGVLMINYDNKYLRLSGLMFVAGIILFSGSLYIMSIAGIKALGMITPFGGVVFLLGWLLMAFGVFKSAANSTI